MYKTEKSSDWPSLLTALIMCQNLELPHPKKNCYKAIFTDLAVKNYYVPDNKEVKIV